MKKKILGVSLVVALGIAGVFYAGSFSAAYYNERQAAFSKIQEALENFSGEVSVYYKDLSDGFEYHYNPDAAYPSASLVKIPVMACVYGAVEEGRISEEKKIPYRRRHRVSGSGSLRYARYGMKFGVDELTYRMIVESDNVATNMLCEALGLGYINENMMHWGLNVTDMKRWVMDLRRRDQGVENYTTAREMGGLLEKIYRGEIVSREASSKMIDVMKHQRHRSRIPRYLPPDTVVANKTGLMRDVVHDAGIVFTGKGDYVLCVLTRNIPSKRAMRLIGEISYVIYDVHNSKKESGTARLIQ